MKTAKNDNDVIIKTNLNEENQRNETEKPTNQPKKKYGKP
jgi:hypothetical protein